MTDLLELRCNPLDLDGLHSEITRRNKIIRSLMLQVERGLNAGDSDYALLQTTFSLEGLIQTRTAELKRSVEELEAFMAHAPIGILITRDQHIQRHNRKFVETFGFRRDEAIGQPTRILFRTTREYDYAQRLASPLLSSSQTIRSELYMRSQNGSDLWINMIGYALQSEKAEQIAIWMLEDRTEFKLAEEALQRNKDELQERVAERTAQLTQQLHFLKQLIEAIPGPVFYKDSKARYLGCNHAFEQFIGLKADQLIGKTPHDISPEALADKYLAADLALLNNPGYQIYNSDVRYANGDIRHVTFHKATFTQADGSVGGIVGLMLDITAQKEAADKIEHLAYYDQLTELPNRWLLLDRLQHATITCSRLKRHGALMMIDLDNFKALNDTQGYKVGDRLLQEVAQRLKSCIREGDTVARLGGDDFVLILEDLAGTDAAVVQAEQAAKKIQNQLRQPYMLEFADTGLHNYYCTASIGVVLFFDQTIPADELLKRADLAMYQAKAEHRNTLCFFDPLIHAQAMRRVGMELDLRNALGKHQFHLYYQPQIDAQGAVFGAEALLRWEHPERGLVSPGEFIPLAEETGIILPLGAWILEKACSQLAAWSMSPETAHLTLAVNVSVRQFHQPDFVPFVIAKMQQYGVASKKLKIEITESLLLNDTEETITKMVTLKSYGVGFSLDDFGTGYSSLAYLRRLPLDQLKIDQSFVRNIMVNTNDTIIARSIVALGQSLGLNVIAEGVETMEQRDLLLTNGCQYYQGYLFSRPLPLEQFLKYVVCRI